MADELTFFQGIIIALISILGAFFSGLATWYLRKREQCDKHKEDRIDKIESRTLRQSKGLLNMAGHLDDIKASIHPDAPAPHFYEKMNTDLKDEKGNL